MVKYPPPPLNLRGLNIAIDIDHYPVIHRQLNVNITLVEISHVNFHSISIDLKWYLGLFQIIWWVSKMLFVLYRFHAQKQPSSSCATIFVWNKLTVLHHGWGVIMWIFKRIQWSFWVLTQPIRDVVTTWRCVSLAEPIPKMIPDIIPQICLHGHTIA